MSRPKLEKAVGAALLLALSGLGAASCGTVQSGTDSSTHWLSQCNSDAECGTLSCVCGLCSLPCEEDPECADLGGACTVVGTCRGQESSQGLCAPACESSDDCQDSEPGFVCSEGLCVAPAPGNLDEPCRSFYDVRLGQPACTGELACTALPTTLQQGGPTCRDQCSADGDCSTGQDCNYGLCLPAGSSELCTSNLLSEAQRASTPREEANLEWLALSMTDEIVADEATYERLVADVAQIKSEYPEVRDIDYFGAQGATTGLILEVDVDTLNDMEHGRYQDWDCLNRVFGVSGFTFIVRSDSASVLVYLDGIYDSEPVVEAYAALPSVQQAYVDDYSGDGSTICVATEGNTWHYVFDEAGGDCPSGCTEHNYYYFAIDGDGSLSSGETWVIDGSGDEPPPAPDWVSVFEAAGYGASPYSFCR